MNCRLVVVALAASGFGIPSCGAQSVPPDTPRLPGPSETASAVETSGDNAGSVANQRSANDPCVGHPDAARKSACFARRFFSTGTFVAPLFTAVPELAKPPAGYPREWRRGPAGFERLYGDALTAQTVQQTSRFLTGLALHEDLRYSPAATRNPLRRVIHAITFTALDRSDSGRTTLAASNFLSPAAGGYVGRIYLPAGYNDNSHALTRMGFQFGSIVVTNLLSEFKPELLQLRKTLHLPGRSVAGGLVK